MDRKRHGENSGGTVGEPTCTVCGSPLAHMADGRAFCPYGHMQRRESGNITYTVAIMLLVVLPCLVFVTHALNTLGGALR